jgi:cytochrome c-type biogenesis protein CcmE
VSNVQGRRRAAIAVAAAIVIGAFGFLLWGGLDKNVVFFLTPKELLSKGNAAYDVPVRLGGMVQAGSVKWDADKLDLRFVVTDGQQQITVHSTGAPPQMFRDSIGVVVEGRYGHDGVFESKSLMVKHSNEYHPPKAGEKPEEMYRSLIKDAKS